jgi:hypothetical protein
VAFSGDFSIGAQVHLRDASPTDPSPWPGEPSGVIVRSAGAAISGVWGGAAGGRLWWVEFDEPRVHSDGTGPQTGAAVLEKYLELAPPIE